MAQLKLDSTAQSTQAAMPSMIEGFDEEIKVLAPLCMQRKWVGLKQLLNSNSIRSWHKIVILALFEAHHDDAELRKDYLLSKLDPFLNEALPCLTGCIYMNIPYGERNSQKIGLDDFHTAYTFFEALDDVAAIKKIQDYVHKNKVILGAGLDHPAIPVNDRNAFYTMFNHLRASAEELRFFQQLEKAQKKRLANEQATQQIRTIFKLGDVECFISQSIFAGHDIVIAPNQQQEVYDNMVKLLTSLGIQANYCCMPVGGSLRAFIQVLSPLEDLYSKLNTVFLALPVMEMLKKNSAEREDLHASNVQSPIVSSVSPSQTQSAIAIQSIFRGHLARKCYLNKKEARDLEVKLIKDEIKKALDAENYAKVTALTQFLGKGNLNECLKMIEAEKQPAAKLS